jgi:hypothetical protein
MTCVETERMDERLIGLLEQQRDVYQQLRSLAQRQGAMISSNDADGLLELLSARQKLVDRLAQLNDALMPMRQRWQELLGEMPEQVRKQIRTLVLEVNDLLQSILTTDARDTQELSARQVSVGRELSRATTGRKAHLAYAPGSKGAARFVDRTDEE